MRTNCENIDHKNKVFFSDSPPVTMYGLWMVAGILGAAASVNEIIFVIPAYICLLWSTYRFFTVLYYRKSGDFTPSYLSFSAKVEIMKEIIHESVLTLFVFIIRCLCIVGMIAFLMSISVHFLLVIIVILLLFKFHRH